MARETRRSGGRKQTRGKRASPLTTKLWWLGGGLAGGLVLGYAAYSLTAVVQQQGARPAVAITTPAQAPAPPARPVPAPEAPPRFDFYTLLPEMEVEITDEKLNEAMQALPKGPDGPYILQVGSFRRHDEADNLKARLALLGIEATIQTVIIRDDDIWYRVRVGPYDSIRDLAQVRNRLNRNDIQFMLLRIGA
jgi:cell division protein FtsN